MVPYETTIALKTTLNIGGEPSKTSHILFLKWLEPVSAFLRDPY